MMVYMRNMAGFRNDFTRYSKPWIAKVISWDNHAYGPAIEFGEYVDSVEASDKWGGLGCLRIKANPGDIIYYGQKDHTGADGANATRKLWGVVGSNRIIKECTREEAVEAHVEAKKKAIKDRCESLLAEYRKHTAGYHVDISTEFHENGVIKCLTNRIEGKRQSVSGMPAVIRYHDDFTIRQEEWFSDDLCGRQDGPASIMYDERGEIAQIAWCRNGKLYREDGPALLKYEGKNEKERTWKLSAVSKMTPDRDIKKMLGDDYSLPLSDAQKSILQTISI